MSRYEQMTKAQLIEELEELRVREQRSRNIIETTKSGYFLIDKTGRYQEVNRAWLDMHGYDSAEEILGQHFALTQVDADIDAAEENVEQILFGGAISSGEFTRRCKDGSVGYHSFTLQPVVRGGEVVGLEGFLIDITERQRAEEKLRKSTELIEGIINAIPARVFWKDKQLNYLGCNAAFARDAGFAEPKDLIGKDDFQMGWRLQAESYRADDRAVLESGHPRLLIEETLTTPAGDVISLLTSKLPLRNSEGEIDGVLGTYMDITERNRAQEALARSERLLAETGKMGKVGGWNLNIDDGKLTWTEETCRIHEVDLSYEPTLGQGIGFYSPASRPIIERAVQRAIEQGEPYDVELEIITAKGNLRAVHAIGRADLEHRRVYGFFQDITEHKRAEEALAHSRDLMRYVIEHNRSAVAVHDRDLKYLYVSQRYLHDYRVTERDVIGKHHYEVFPDLPQKWRDVHQKALAGEISRAEDDPYLRDDGTVDWTRWECRPWHEADGSIGGIIIYTEVITERKQAEEELRITQYSVDRTADAVYWMGADARFIYVNEAACSALGYSRDELLTMTVHDIDPEFPAEVWPAHWADLKERGSFLIETTHRAKDGRVFPVEISVNFLESGNQEFNVVFARDITERRRVEEEKSKLEGQIQQAQKLESLAALAGGIAHDFNNILAVILGNAELALDGLSPHSPARSNLQEIEKASMRAVGLAKQMLAYSGQGQFVIEPIALGELVQEMASLLDVSFSKKAVLKYDFADNLPTFDGDAAQVSQIIMNLVVNASEAVGDQSGVIALSTGAMLCDRSCLDELHPSVVVGPGESLVEGLYVYLKVADTGSGMDAETIERIFDPFFTTKFMGRGLGMSATLGIVRGHKGAIKIYSEVGKGTTIKVLFPANELSENGGTALEGGRGEGVAEKWQGEGTVLIVDDEETVCAMGRQMLERLGFTVLTAADGREAVETLRERADEIVCVLLDLTMPHMDGEEAFRELRRIQPDVRVILCSGYNSQTATQRFTGKGLAGFIQKPYTMAELREKLGEILPAAAKGE